MLNWTEKRPIPPLQEQDALDLLLHFYERWAAVFQGQRPLDCVALADWVAGHFDRIEHLVMGRPDDPLKVGLVAVAQADPAVGATRDYAVFSRAARFQKSLRFDSPHIALFPTEELAQRAAEKAQNRCPTASLFFIHLSFGVMPMQSGDGDQFAVATQVRARALDADSARC